MNKKYLFLLVAVVLIIIFLLLFFVIFKPFSKDKKDEMDYQFKIIEKRYNDLLNSPLPKNQQDLEIRIKQGEKLKTDHDKLIKQAETSNIYDNNLLDTKEKLLKRIDNKIGVLNDMIPTKFDLTIAEQKEEFQRVKIHIEELKSFRKKVEAASENDTAGIKILITEYENTLMYKKVEQ